MYRMSSAQRLNIKERKDLLRFEELERGYVTYNLDAMVCVRF